MKLENENICTICLEEIQLYPITKLNCSHFFHLNCINLWKEKKNICPICRKQIIIPKEKKHKSKCCLSLFELSFIICFIILFFSFFIFMILKSVEKLKKKKNWNIKYKQKNKTKHQLNSLFFDLILAKQNERKKILINYATNFPNMIKNNIENFFDNIVEEYYEFIYSFHNLTQFMKYWRER